MQQNKGFDKNQLINFIIFSVILIGGMFYFQNRQINAENEAKNKTITQTQQQESAHLNLPTDH